MAIIIPIWRLLFSNKKNLFENNNRQIGIFCLKIENPNGDYYPIWRLLFSNKK